MSFYVCICPSVWHAYMNVRCFPFVIIECFWSVCVLVVCFLQMPLMACYLSKPVFKCFLMGVYTRHPTMLSAALFLSHNNNVKVLLKVLFTFFCPFHSIRGWPRNINLLKCVEKHSWISWLFLIVIFICIVVKRLIEIALHLDAV